jgi:hypothetical protein
MADGDMIGGLISLVLVVAAIAAAVVIVYYLLVYVLLPAGALFGAFTALRNYVQALVANIRPERAPS